MQRDFFYKINIYGAATWKTPEESVDTPAAKVGGDRVDIYLMSRIFLHDHTCFRSFHSNIGNQSVGVITDERINC